MDTPKVLTRDEALQLVREYKRVISPRFDGKAKVMMVCWSCKREGESTTFIIDSHHPAAHTSGGRAALFLFGRFAQNYKKILLKII